MYAEATPYSKEMVGECLLYSDIWFMSDVDGDMCRNLLVSLLPPLFPLPFCCLEIYGRPLIHKDFGNYLYNIYA